MTSDEQEALSHIHTGWWCVPLSSGRIAVFDHPMKPASLKIAASWQHLLTFQRPVNEELRPEGRGRERGPNLNVELDL